MLRTRREILDQFVEYIGEANDPAARALAENLLDRALETIWQYRTWRQFVMPMPYTLTTVAGQASYSLPSYFGRVSGKDGKIRNLTTSGLVRAIELERLQELYPEQGTPLEVAGTPAYYALGGSVGVRQQPPPTGQALYALSTSAADVTVRVRVTGISIGGGGWGEAEAVLAGVGQVLLMAWDYVASFSKAYPPGATPTTPDTSSEGTVTLFSSSGPTALEELPPNESAHEYQQLVFYPKPSTVQTYAIPLYRRPKPLTSDTDSLPDHWDPALLEEMTILYRVNTGELQADGANPGMRPKLADLVAFENLSASRPVVRPFSG